MPILALLPLVSNLAPQLVNWLFGPKAGATASAAAQVVQAVTGHDASTAEGIAAATADIAADPAKMAALRVQLAQIAAQAAEDTRKDDMASLAAQLGDVASARAQTVALAQAHSATAYGSSIVSVVVLVGFVVAYYLVMTKPIPADSQPVVIGLTEAVKACAIAVVGYWVGSSVGSARKDSTIAGATTALANSTPVNAGN